jgi:cell wall-associated NlpC family hydrolase
MSLVSFFKSTLASTVATVLAVTLAVSSGYADPAPVDLDRQLQTAWKQLETVIEQFDASQDEARATSTQLRAVAAQIPPLQRSVAAAQARVGEISSALYRGGQVGSFVALVSAPTPDVLMDQLAVLDHIERDRRRDLALLQASRDNLVGRQRELRGLLARREAQQTDLATRKSSIQGQIDRLLELRGRTGRGGYLRSPRGALHDGYVPLFTDDAAGQAVKFAYQQLGKTYKFAAEGPNAYDCSGLVMASWKQAGVVLPHNALRQYKTVRPITRAELKPGDLVFYYHDVSHVAIYIGDNRVIEAPQPGEKISMRMIDFAPIVGYGRPVGQ